MVTVAPTGADVGVKPLIVGRRTTMRSVAAVVVPPGVVMVMRPVCAVAGTVMRTSVSVLDAASTGAGTEPIRATAPPSVVPVIVIEPLTRATVGANDVIRGVTRNAVALETLPPVNASVIGPEVARSAAAA